jgi:hypothetical protein
MFFKNCFKDEQFFKKIIEFEVFTAVPMKNAVFWDVMPCDSCKNQRFRGMYRLNHQDEDNQ